ncbi:MAG: chloride channel protein, partial [Bacteriovorax sp.]
MKKIIASYLNITMISFSTHRAAIVNGLIIGTVVGLAIALYDWLVNDVLIQNFKSLPLTYLGLLPFVGMLITGIIIKSFSISRTSMADDVVYAYHTEASNLELKKSVPKLFASISTIAFGGSAGLEGSSKWVGAIVGLFIQKIINFFKPLKKLEGDLTIALMTGASAGIGAIFK